MSLTTKINTFGKIIKHQRELLKVVKRHIKFVEMYDEQTVWGSITNDEEEGLKWAAGLAAHYEGPIVEIGALFGHTTNLLASLKAETVPLIAVENFTWNPFCLPKANHRRFTQRSLKYVLDHCATEIYDGNAEDFYSANPTLRPSMVFIDAGHDYESVRQDIDWAISSGCPVISGHDYSDLHGGVVRAVDESFGDKISLYGSVWIHQQEEDE